MRSGQASTPPPFSASNHPDVSLRHASLLSALAATRKTYGVGAIRRPLLLTAIGRAAIAYYSASCVAADGLPQDAVDAVAIRLALRSVDASLSAAQTALADAEGDEAALVSLGVSTRGKASAAHTPPAASR